MRAMQCVLYEHFHCPITYFPSPLGSEFLPQAFTLRVLPYSARVSKHTVVVKCSSLRRCPVRKRIAQLREATNESHI